MVENSAGFLVANQAADCNQDSLCLDVCPFDTRSKLAADETIIADQIFEQDNKKSERIGSYKNLYAGHANDYRESSSSGGIASYLIYQILDQGIVSHVVSVTQNSGDSYYQYKVLSSKDDVIAQSKTRYYPVTMAEALKRVKELNGNIAVVGVACFLKGIRKAETVESLLKGRVKFTIGIICGGVKGKPFTEYLISKVGVEKAQAKRPEYRVKNKESDAADYSFSCSTVNETRSIEMRTVGDMWGTGLFKANACDFCQDVTTELADISLGDAWMDPYKNDGLGTNIIITRSILAEKLIVEGSKNNKLSLTNIELDDVIQSQKGSFNHRQDALFIRTMFAKLFGKKVPKFRFRFKTLAPDVIALQFLRRIVRAKSIGTWVKVGDAKEFDQKMRPYLKILSLAARAVNKRRKLFKRNVS
jgi:coenzyme F420-reducing hydrogenase beta subunit